MSGKGFSQPKRDDNEDLRHQIHREMDKRKNEDDDDEDEEEKKDDLTTKRPKKMVAVAAAAAAAPISIKLSPFQKTLKGSELKAKKAAVVANVFGNDDDDEEEEMPPEAKMRMRNMGRDTPTSTGPNSFGKTRQGFCDSRKGFDKTEKKKSDVVTGHGRSHE